MKKFDYDYCVICESEMIKTTYMDRGRVCKNECCNYRIHHDGLIATRLFDDVDREYLIKNEGDYTTHQIKHKNRFDKDEEDFLNRIKYWKENDRYLVKILEGN